MTSAVLAAALAATMMTPWGEKVTDDNAWREYPRPQMVRDNWTCLNGRWDYAVVSNDVDGWSHEIAKGKIRVPFPIESQLSGVGRLTGKDELIEYRRTFEVKARKGFRQILRFDGVDYRAQVFVNGVEAGVPHEGAFTGFSYDVTDLVKDGANDLMVRVWDPTEGFVNPLGKQSTTPKGCFYTRMSGIWQTVWMETVPETYIRGYKVTTDIDKGDVWFEFDVCSPVYKDTPVVRVSVEGGVGATSVGGFKKDEPWYVNFRGGVEATSVGGFKVGIPMPEDFVRWSPENPKLYEFTATCGADRIRGYFAMRKFEKRKDAKGVLRFFLNNKPYFIVGTLDQGWWPDGLLTPPSEEAMAHDIKTLKACGFNMMRKHIKVEPLRYYALCDRLGLLVLQDMPSGDEKTMFNFAHANVAYGTVRREWQAVMDKLMNVPSIVMWIPYNEQWTQPGEALTADMLRWTKRYDPTRLVNGPSGWRDYEGGDSSHDDKCRAWSKHRPAGEEEACDAIDRHDYNTRPTMHAVNPHRVSFLGEYGGIGCRVKGHLWTEDAWGYGGTGDDTDRKALEKKYVELSAHVATLAEKGLGGCVYTQTTDVEGEINGLMSYDRKVLKYDAAVLKEAHRKICEKGAVK